MQESAHDLELLAAFVEGRLEGEDRRRVIAHTADCRHCREILAQLARATPDEQRVTSPRRSQLRVWLPLAASVLIATFAWFQFAVTPRSGAPEVTATEEDLLAKRSGAMSVAGKTFRMRSGTWIDTSLDAAAEAPTVLVQGSEARAMWVERVPELAPYAELGDRVTVAWQGTVYRFEP